MFLGLTAPDAIPPIRSILERWRGFKKAFVRLSELSPAVKIPKK
jgi:hypothetical protein